MRIFLIFSFCIFSMSLSAQTGVRQLYKTTAGCSVLDRDHSPKDSLIWDGACRGHLAEGFGRLRKIRNGATISTFTGYLKKGVPFGQGKYLLPGNYSIEGTFVSGYLQGPGKLNDDGDISEGSFINDVLQGKGKITFETGLTLTGNFVNGVFINLDEQYLSGLKRIELPLADTSGIYNATDKQHNLFYYTLSSPGTIKGVIILIPSSGETAENVICCNKTLMQQAADSQILTVVISVNSSVGLDDDKLTLGFLNGVIGDVIGKYHLAGDKVLIGGLSGGGMLALRYTELSRDKPEKALFKPVAVFGADPPVDIAGLYNRSKRDLDLTSGKKNLSPAKLNGLREAKAIVTGYAKLYGGSPEQVPEQYIRHSMFSRSQTDGGNAKYLVAVPVRLYCDPDILWQLRERNLDYYDMNAADLSAMINCLNLDGNKNAELIPALGKGYRLDGTRHPHSWSIIDPDDFIKWAVRLFNGS